MEEKMKKVIIIDALNLFIRNYVVNPTMDSKGVSIGGCIGFLKSLQKITRILKPDQIIRGVFRGEFPMVWIFISV